MKTIAYTFLLVGSALAIGHLAIIVHALTGPVSVGLGLFGLAAAILVIGIGWSEL